MIGTVAALFRYPVKSLQGFAVESLDVTPRGVGGDRRFALVDAATDRILSAKVAAVLLLAEAVEEADGTVSLHLPDGATVRTDDPDVHARLSAWIGRPVRLDETPGTATDPEAAAGLTYDDRWRSYEMTFEPDNDDAELVAIPAPAGTFLDLAAVHVLTTGSLARCREAAPDVNWDVRRFRPNVLVTTEGDGFPENEWVGSRVRLGAAALSVDSRTVRCAMPVRAQPAGIERSVAVYRTLAAICENHLGVYCSVATPGRVAVGDPVEISA